MHQAQAKPAARIRIKVCGITRSEDARIANEFGADAIGMIFYPHTPRGITVKQAQEILQNVPPFLTTVGVFVDPSGEELASVLRQVPLDLVQFHGHETPSFCESINRPYIKSIPMREGVNLQQLARDYQSARALLLETPSDTLKGGTGQAFDWQLATAKTSIPVILAGGLNPSNVAQAIHTVHPACVDANSGVELQPGIKDADKIAAFIREVQRVQSHEYQT